jgi:quinol monooxygenase YgiN
MASAPDICCRAYQIKVDGATFASIYVDKERKMIIVMGYAHTAPGEIDRVQAGLAAMVAATNAEDGCEYYGFSRDVNDPDRMIISERWRDQAALDAHFASAHMATFNALLGTVDMKDVSVRAYENGEMRVLIGH